MTIEVLVRYAFANQVTLALVEETCSEMNISRTAFLDAFAREVAEGYAIGKYTWEDGDLAMNATTSYAWGPSADGFTDYAYQVYTAFDEGESQEGGESVTKELLSKIK